MPPDSPQTDAPVLADQHPRGMSRLRLLPLAVLMVLVVTAGAVGIVHGGPVTTGGPAAAEPGPGKAAKRAAKARKQCVPAYDTGLTSEPWSKARRAASEKVTTDLADWDGRDFLLLHVAMKRLGQTICRDASPRCGLCALAAECPSVGTFSRDPPKPLSRRPSVR